MLKRIFKLSLIIYLFTIFSISAAAQTGNSNQTAEQPQVISATAPQYPAAASALGIKGEVVVEVKINEKGEVTAAKSVSGRDRLYEASEKAAKDWKFSESFARDKKERTALITFNYSILFDTNQRSRENIVIFKPPYTVEVILNPGIISSAVKLNAQKRNRGRLNSTWKLKKKG